MCGYCTMYEKLVESVNDLEIAICCELGCVCDGGCPYFCAGSFNTNNIDFSFDDSATYSFYI